MKDTGIGMSPAFAARIFEPFERERNSTVSKIQGTGLGMAITKNIIDMMGGEIEVHTEQGKGTEFVIRYKADQKPRKLYADHHSHRLRLGRHRGGGEGRGRSESGICAASGKGL